jgi:hypothetical protein
MEFEYILLLTIVFVVKQTLIKKFQLINRPLAFTHGCLLSFVTLRIIMNCKRTPFY